MFTLEFIFSLTKLLISRPLISRISILIVGSVKEGGNFIFKTSLNGFGYTDSTFNNSFLSVDKVAPPLSKLASKSTAPGNDPQSGKPTHPGNEIV